MPVGADPSFGWQEAIAAFAIVAVVAFLVTWIVTDRLHVSRTPYIAILTVVTLGLGAGYLAWSGTALMDLVTPGWGWAIVAGLVVGGAMAPALRRMPHGARPEGGSLAGAHLGEGVVYGVAEGILLATLPVLAVWQATDALGWTGSTWVEVGSGALAVAGSLLVIAVHHLGYREFRGPIGRPKLVGALAGCGIQALAFLLTGNLLAPVVAHIVLHGQLVVRGIEMPPAGRVRLMPVEMGGAVPVVSRPRSGSVR
ncbi:MAG: hypothetical protein ACXWYE_05380 [Actinomycetota bacterium]